MASVLSAASQSPSQIGSASSSGAPSVHTSALSIGKSVSASWLHSLEPSQSLQLPGEPQSVAASSALSAGSSHIPASQMSRSGSPQYSQSPQQLPHSSSQLQDGPVPLLPSSDAPGGSGCGLITHDPMAEPTSTASSRMYEVRVMGCIKAQV